MKTWSTLITWPFFLSCVVAAVTGLYWQNANEINKYLIYKHDSSEISSSAAKKQMFY